MENNINNLIGEAQTLADKTGGTFVVAENKATGYVGVASIDNVFTNPNGNQYDLRIIAKVEPTEANCDWCGEVMLQGDAVVRSLTGANYVDNYYVCPECAEHGGDLAELGMSS